jgi:hypothetical protein
VSKRQPGAKENTSILRKPGHFSYGNAARWVEAPFDFDLVTRMRQISRLQKLKFCFRH